jgi:nucleoside diphosphate kinase
MKPDVVRRTFIARLNSELESTVLKVALARDFPRKS